MRIRSVRRHTGSTYLEVIVASAVCVLSLSVMIQLWAFSMQLAARTTDKAVACSLARQTVETLKETGFSQTPEATSSAPLVHYFAVDTSNQDNAPNSARYKVTTTVVSDATVAGSNPVTPAPTALRQVTVTVTLAQSGTTLTTLTTYLVRAGI